MNEEHYGRRSDELEESIDESMEHSTTDQRMMSRKSYLSFMPSQKTLILIGGGILFCIILIVLFSGENSELSKNDLAGISARLDLFEKRLTRLEEVEPRIVTLQKQGTLLEQSMTETDRSIEALTQRVNSLTQRLEVTGQETTSAAQETRVPVDTKRKAVSPEKRRVHEVRKGENLYRISSKYRLTVDELCRLNNIDPNNAIYPGQKLIVTSGGD